MKSNELKKALESVRPGLATKELMEQATSILFREDSIQTFNDEVAVIYPLKSGILGAVPAEPIYKFLSKLDGEAEINVEQGENELKLSCGRNRAGIRMDPEIKLPLDEELSEPEEWASLPEKFLPALKLVLFSASRSGHKPILTCVHITESWLETCDGFRLTRCNCETSNTPEHEANGEKPLFSTKVIARHLEKLPNYSPDQFGFSGNWLHFKNSLGSGVRYCVRMIEAEYPNLDEFIQVEGPEIQFPKELEGALDWASVMTDGTIKYEQKVSVDISKRGMVVKGEGPDGWAEETIRMRYQGEQIGFQAHPSFLREMAKLARKVTVSKEALKVEGEGFIHVVSLDSGE